MSANGVNTPVSPLDPRDAILAVIANALTAGGTNFGGVIATSGGGGGGTVAISQAVPGTSNAVQLVDSGVCDIQSGSYGESGDWGAGTAYAACLFSPDFNGSVGEVAFLGSTSAAYTFVPPDGKRLPLMAVVVNVGSVNISGTL